ncbi:MAG: CAP domain-containing protein, partial [Nannocystaceae bacterium]
PTGTTSDPSTTDASTTDPTTEGTTTTTSDPTTTSTSTTGPMTTSTTGDPNDVCARWLGDRADLAEGAWSGDGNACQAGDVAAPGRANALKSINLYRWLADLPEVADDPTRNAKSQACALMMHANGQLSHTPPMNWKCYSGDGSEAAGKSNIAGAPGVEAIDLYMADPGNATTFGHRRWILSNGLGPVGIGSTSNYSCLWVIGGNGGGNNAYTAWPAPGEFPIQAMTASWQSVDQTGWTIQSSAIDLKAAQVKITMDGADKPVTVAQLQANYGSSQAISMVPQGWTSQAGKTYSVAVSGVNPPIQYDVTFVDCQ